MKELRVRKEAAARRSVENWRSEMGRLLESAPIGRWPATPPS